MRAKIRVKEKEKRVRQGGQGKKDGSRKREGERVGRKMKSNKRKAQK